MESWCQWRWSDNQMIESYYLGIVMHLVLQLWVVMAFSSSSRPVDFFNFLTRLLTAFSLHLSSPSAFFQPSSRLTIGGLKLGSIEVIISARWNVHEPHRAALMTNDTTNLPIFGVVRDYCLLSLGFTCYTTLHLRGIIDGGSDQLTGAFSGWFL